MRSARATALALTALTLGLLAVFPAAAMATWKPEAASYGIGEDANVGVRMRDGTVLRANVFYPTDPKTGTAAAGPFPVIMVQDPYGKDTTGSASGQEGVGEASTETGKVPDLIERGYIDVVAEVRGTGGSEGTFNLLDPIQGQDGAALVRWAAGLPHANGKVGLYGPSYMGLDEYMTANALGPGSPLKAMFPIVAGNDTYRDIAFDGGILDAEADLILTGTVFGPLEELNPLAEDYPDLAELIKVESEHAPGLASYNADQIENIMTGGDEAFDGSYWQARAPRNMLAHLVADRVPVFAVDGWFDLYQRGAPLNYSGLQNAYDGRAVNAPMLPGQRVSGRYQLLQGPWYHLDAGTDFDIYGLELAWFDRWLKDEPTGIDRTSTPLHLYQLGANRWVDTIDYPVSGVTPTTYYLSGGPSGSGAPSRNDGVLTQAPPTSDTGADQVAYSAATSPCSRGTEQWGAGGLQLVLDEGMLPPDPCAQNDLTLQSGPGALTYTTAPFTHATTLAGPIDATIYATATSTDTEWVATVEDISADGLTSFPLTAGALLGSFRALDDANTWFGPNRQPILPYHPYTQTSETPVAPGQVTRYDIEVFPTVAELAPGHRLRLTLTTSDSPHLLPIPEQAANLTGGIYELQRHRSAASFIELPLTTANLPSSSLSYSSGPPPSPRFSCARPSGRLAGRSLGPVQLGMTRKHVRGLFRRFSTRGRRYMDFFCPARNGIRVGYPSPKLLRTLSRVERHRIKGRAVLALTSNPHYALRGVHPGAGLAMVARRLHVGQGFHIGLNWWYLTPNGRSRGVLKVRQGVIEEIGIADKQLTNHRPAQWRFLTSFN
jgi:putative CocE/NonD family hydrolase